MKALKSHVLHPNLELIVDALQLQGHVVYDWQLEGLELSQGERCISSSSGRRSSSAGSPSGRDTHTTKGAAEDDCSPGRVCEERSCSVT